MREEERNRLLRRIDWRFLLPTSAPEKVLCLSEDLVEPLRLVCGTVRTEAGATESDFDLAAATDPSAEALARARAALRAGGCLYTEWRTPVSGGWQEIVSRLGRAGFEDVSCFWPRPDPARAPATVWIPLETNGPLNYYRTRRTATRNPLRLAGRLARRIQWIVRSRRPVCVVARRPADPGSPRESRRDASIDTIRESWRDWGLGPTPTRIVELMKAAPGRTSGKVVGFLFANGERVPRLVAKRARTPAAAAGLEREGEILRSLEARRSGIGGIPRVLDWRPEGILVETALPGLPLPTFLRRSTYPALADAATSWLADLAGADEGPPKPCGVFVDRVLRDFESRFGAAVDPGVWRDAVQILAELPPLRRTCEQRDFSPWNVLWTPPGTLSVLDWESADLDGLPALDLVYFLTYLALYYDHAVRNGRHRESFRRTLQPTTLTGRVARECLARYAERTGVPAAALRPLRVLTWLLHSRSEYRHLEEDAGGPPEPARLRRSFFLDLLREELGDAAS